MQEDASSFFGAGVGLEESSTPAPEALPVALPTADTEASPSAADFFGGDTEESWHLVEASQEVSGRTQEEEAEKVVRQKFESDHDFAQELAAPLTIEAEKKGEKKGRTTGSRFTVLKVSLLVIVLAVLAGFVLTRPAVTEFFAPKQVVVHQGTDLGVVLPGAAEAVPSQ